MADNINKNQENTSPETAFGGRDPEFDKKYHRAANESFVKADKLLNELSRETEADKYNFLGFAIPALIIMIAAVSFALVNRGDIEEQLSVRFGINTLADGSYTENLNDVYESTLPFSDKIKTVGAALGFCEKPAAQEDDIPDAPPQPQEPAVSEPAVTEPAVTEPPVTQTEPTSPPETTVTEPTIPLDEVPTITMYAAETVNVRLGPSNEDAVIGCFITGNAVEVIEIRPDGWAEIKYDDIRAYVYAEYLEGGESSSDDHDDENPPEAQIINPDDYDTYTMISNASVNVRSTPGTNGAILGTFGTGDEVNVIEIEDNGWAAIVYGDMLAYVFADYLDEPSESEPQQPDEELQIPDEGTDGGEEELQIPDDSNTDGIIDEDYTESIVTLPPDEGSSPDGNSTDGGAYNITTDEGAAS